MCVQLFCRRQTIGDISLSLLAEVSFYLMNSGNLLVCTDMYRILFRILHFQEIAAKTLETGLILFLFGHRGLLDVTVDVWSLNFRERRVARAVARESSWPLEQSISLARIRERTANGSGSCELVTRSAIDLHLTCSYIIYHI